jgi:glutamyl-tRNA synthetase
MSNSKKNNMKKNNIRVRFAPSPTGEMHIGSARTALFNFLFARHNKGKILLRIEDTDAKRYVPGSVERIIEDLNWLGIEFDEGPVIGNSNFKAQILNKIQNSKSKTINKNLKLSAGWRIKNSYGKYGPYIQSERLGLYQEYAQKLVEDDQAYYCFCSEDRLKEMRLRQEKSKQAPMYDRKCLALTRVQVEKLLKEKKSYVIRMKVPYSGNTEFDDLIRGHISIDNSTIDDQILIKSDGMPTYHLANVVDDHLMEISHVIRAEEWLPSTPKHILLYKAFGWQPPEYAHIPLVLAKDKSKLSKRHGAVSIEEFRKLGYLPEALINYIALLGWNPKTEKEFFTLDELIKEFDIKKVNKAGAVFDIDKLDYFNSHCIKKVSDDLLKKYIFENLLINNIDAKEKLKSKNLDKIIAVIKNRMVKLSDFTELSNVFFTLVEYNPELLVFKKSDKETTSKGLNLIAYSLKLIALSDWESSEKLNDVLLKTVNDNELSNGDVFWPVRVALSGLEKSPSPTEMLWVLGKIESLKRINKAIKMVEQI